MLKTLFFGTPDFALPSFRACLEHSTLLGVVTQPDRPRGRGHQVLPCPVKEAALATGLPAFSPASLRKPSADLEALQSFFRDHPADLFVVTAYGNLLPQTVLDLPRLGCVNVHASLLPRWRGAAPIQRSLEAGDTETGVCLQKMVMELDAGDVLLESRQRLTLSENAKDLTASLSQAGGDLLVRFFQSAPTALVGRPQDASAVTIAPKIRREEALWKASWSATGTHNKVRAFAAWPVVQAQIEGLGLCKLIRTELLVNPPSAALNLEPGELRILDKKVCLGSSLRPSEPRRALVLEQFQPPNKGPQKAYDVLQNEFKKRAAAGLAAPRLVQVEGAL